MCVCLLCVRMCRPLLIGLDPDSDDDDDDYLDSPVAPGVCLYCLASLLDVAHVFVG